MGGEAIINNLVKLLCESAGRYGRKCFAVDNGTGTELTFTGLQETSESVAAAILETASFPEGAPRHVALLLPNCLEILPAYFGILRANCIAVPINARLKAAELQFILGDCEAIAVFVHPATWKAAEEALKSITWNKPVIAVGFEEAPPGTVSFEKFIESAAGRSDTLPQIHATRDDVAAIIYTSGTTGRPKGAMLTHGNILFNIESTKAGHGLVGTDVHLLVVPLFHVTGLNTIMPTALEQGAQLVVSASIDPEDIIETVARFKCSTFFGVPTTFYLLTNLCKENEIEKAAQQIAVKLSSLRLICYSGAPMSPLTIQRLRKMFPKAELHNFYGLTESTSVSTVLPDSQALVRSESIGLPPPGLELCIINGELCMRGPSVFKGYFKRAEATSEAFADGWFHTGDAATIDSEGYVFLRGRKKELIIVAGENVYPIEVENVLCAHSAVQEAAVFGRPDAALGEVVHAAVVLRPGQELSERELRAFANPRLASFKLPRTIRFLDKLPRNPSGKVMKRDL